MTRSIGWPTEAVTNAAGVISWPSRNLIGMVTAAGAGEDAVGRLELLGEVAWSLADPSADAQPDSPKTITIATADIFWTVLRMRPSSLRRGT